MAVGIIHNLSGNEIRQGQELHVTFTELKRVTLSRQSREMHNRPFSWSIPRQ